MNPTNNLSIGTQTAFCTRIRKTLGDKFNFVFSSAYFINPELDKKDEVPTKPAVISYDTGELDEETPSPLHEWCQPALNCSEATEFNSSDTDPTPIKQVTWAASSKPSVHTSSEKTR